MEDDHQQEEFLLKWNDHHNSFFSIVQDLCASELLTDVTLACGSGEPIIFEAHKLMLSVCSTFFRNILTRKRADRYQSHPIVFLKDVEPRHMEQLLQYMYRGEINVLQDDLGPLIETARALQVKGLADAPPGTGSAAASSQHGGHHNQKKRPTPPPHQLPSASHLPTLQANLPPLKKAKTNHSSKKESQPRHPPLPTSQLAQRLTQPKRPPFMPPLPTEPEPPETVRGGGSRDGVKEDQIDLWGAPVVGDQDTNSGDGEDYGGFDESEMHDDGHPRIDQVVSLAGNGGGGGGGGSGSLGAEGSTDPLAGGGGSGLDFSMGLPLHLQLASGGGRPNGNPNPAAVDNRRHECPYCGKKFPTPSKLQRHQLIHTGEKPFSCEICCKGFTQLTHLKNHMRFSHRPAFMDEQVAAVLQQQQSATPPPSSAQE